jgi:hypothetical protein
MQESLEQRLAKLEAQLASKKSASSSSKPVAILGAIGCLLLGATVAFATGTFSSSYVPSTIPYEGYLEVGGAPVNENTDITFTLKSTGSDNSVTEIWGPVTKDVEVANGRFAVVLGGVGLESSELTGTISVAIAVDGVAVGEQPIHSVPFAGKARSADEFDADSVNVSGTVTSNIVSSGEVNVTGNITSDAAVTAATLTADAVVAPFTTPSYDSGWTETWSFTNNIYAQNHSLDGVPMFAMVQLRLKADLFGLLAGDVVYLTGTNTNHRADIGHWIGHTVTANATQVKFNSAKNGYGYISMPTETTDMRDNNWEIRLLAWR